MKIREYVKRVGDSCVTDSQKLSFYLWVGRLHEKGIISDDTILYITKSNNNDKEKTRKIRGQS